jgi:acetyl esterase/lipase
VPVAFLILSCIGAVFAVLAYLPAPRASKAAILFFLAALLVGEIAPVHIFIQAVVTFFLIRAGALDAWPGWVGLVITLASWALLIAGTARAYRTTAVMEDALVDALGPDYRSRIDAERRSLLREGTASAFKTPFRGRDKRVERVKNLSYGPAGKRNLLDVYRPKGERSGCPVLVQVHGGSWVQGSKQGQALPLMLHLSSQGWVCVAPNYRLSPAATFPDHLVDIKRVLAWVRQHAAEHGADPSFIAITGGSAGAHLSALAGLTANDPAYQLGFEDADTSVSAVVPLYGVYDLLDRRGIRPTSSLTDHLRKKVMKVSPEEDPEAWARASPTCLVRPDAPPFFVIHGGNDSLLSSEDARDFVDALREVSHSPVVYAELPGAQHSFDTFHSVRAVAMVEGVARFLAWAWSSTRLETKEEAEP